MPPLAPPPHSRLLSESCQGSRVQELGLKKGWKSQIFRTPCQPGGHIRLTWAAEKVKRGRRRDPIFVHMFTGSCLGQSSLNIVVFRFTTPSLKLCGRNLSANQQMLQTYIHAIRPGQVSVNLKTRKYWHAQIF